MKTAFLAALIACAGLGGPIAAYAQDAQSPDKTARAPLAPAPTAPVESPAKTVALYGNSYTHYNNNLNTRLRDLTRSLLPEKAKGYSYRGVTISSGLLGWHAPNLVFQNSLKQWDTVIFQGNSMEPIAEDAEDRAYFTKSAVEMAQIAQEAGSAVVYFMTWAPKDQPELTEPLAKAYVEIAAKTGGYVAPVGLAFAAGAQRFPEIDLYHPDGKHPSLEGTYLAACVFFATLYNQSPLGGDIPIASDMSPETARRLQILAWDTVQAFRS